MTSLLKPILLLGSGRTGSTLAMSILASSDDVVFNKQYPFETRLLTYVAHMANLVTKPSSDIPNWSHGSLNKNELDMMGPIPFPINNYIKSESLSKSVFDSLWESIGNQMREAEKRPNAYLYAEKAPNFLKASIEKYTDIVNIRLIRDPRDVLISTKSFNEKRGTRRFGWLEDDTDKSYAVRLVRRTERLLKDAVNESESGQSLIVRYEDLISDQQNTIDLMSEWCGTQFKPPAEKHNYLKKHSTSDTPKSSVARWRTELDPDVSSYIAESLSSLLKKFDYEV